MGNTLLRRLLVEAAWHYHHEPASVAPCVCVALGQSAAVLAVADKARASPVSALSSRVRAAEADALVIAAIARELVGFIWAVIQLPAARA